MIQRYDYTDEEWVELVARCRVMDLPPQRGLWVWCAGKDLMPSKKGEQILLITYVAEWGYNVQSEDEQLHIVDKGVVLPLLSQLLRHERWSSAFHLRKMTPNPGWGVWDTIEEDWICPGPTPELTALMVIQFCENRCNHPYEVVRSEHPKGRPCAGIHPFGNCNRRCLTHSLQLEEVSA